MEVNNGKYAWMVKIGEKGQFVIPKEARNLFDLQPGMEILVLGDEKEVWQFCQRKCKKNILQGFFQKWIPKGW